MYWYGGLLVSNGVVLVVILFSLQAEIKRILLHYYNDGNRKLRFERILEVQLYDHKLRIWYNLSAWGYLRVWKGVRVKSRYRKMDLVLLVISFKELLLSHSCKSEVQLEILLSVWASMQVSQCNLGGLEVSAWNWYQGIC